MQRRQQQRQVGQFAASLRCRRGSVSAREISRVNNNKGQTAVRFNMANLTTISGFGIGIEIFGGAGVESRTPKERVLVRIILGYNLAY